jgi:hypothetical protein
MRLLQQKKEFKLKHESCCCQSVEINVVERREYAQIVGGRDRLYADTRPYNVRYSSRKSGIVWSRVICVKLRAGLKRRRRRRRRRRRD